MNTKEKGNIAVGRAIAYFTKNNYVVSIPLNDSQEYDLLVDKEGIIHKVQVKYTSSKATSGFYTVGLRSISGSSREEYSRLCDSANDLLFIVTEEYKSYLVPISELTVKTTVTINKEFVNKYIELT